MEMKSGTFVSYHYWVVCALCAGAESLKLHGRGCWKKSHPNIESLKLSLRKAAADFPVDVLHYSIDEWPLRLKDSVHANGGHFE